MLTVIKLIGSLIFLFWFLHTAAKIQRAEHKMQAAMRRLDIWQGCSAGCEVCTIGCEKHRVEYIDFNEE